MLAVNSIPTLFDDYKSACKYCNASRTTHHDCSFHDVELNKSGILNVTSRSRNKKKNMGFYDPAVYSVMNDIRISKLYGLDPNEEETSKWDDSEEFLQHFLK
uniref:Uncharacterized protein n=1 Tax=Graphocephala atropunctata TaxID=36148 RepID=A0A1B6MPP8_9HEMI